jgi:hypothetical protein
VVSAGSGSARRVAGQDHLGGHRGRVGRLATEAGAGRAAVLRGELPGVPPVGVGRMGMVDLAAGHLVDEGGVRGAVPGRPHRPAKVLLAQHHVGRPDAPQLRPAHRDALQHLVRQRLPEGGRQGIGRVPALQGHPARQHGRAARRHVTMHAGSSPSYPRCDTPEPVP